MPTYEYRCPDCTQELEVVQSIHEPSLTQCPSCNGTRLRKVFSNVGVVFKGSGFYRTDSRSRSGAPSAPSSTSTTPGSGEAKPKAAATPAPSPSSAASSASAPASA